MELLSKLDPPYLKTLIADISRLLKSPSVKLCTWKGIADDEGYMELAPPLADGEQRDSDTYALVYFRGAPSCMNVLVAVDTAISQPKFRLLNSAMTYDCLARANVATSDKAAQVAQSRTIQGRQSKNDRRARSQKDHVTRMKKVKKESAARANAFSDRCKVEGLSAAKATTSALKTPVSILSTKNGIPLPESFDSPPAKSAVTDLTLPQGLALVTEPDDEEDDEEDETNGDGTATTGAVVEDDDDDDGDTTPEANSIIFP